MHLNHHVQLSKSATGHGCISTTVRGLQLRHPFSHETRPVIREALLLVRVKNAVVSRGVLSCRTVVLVISKRQLSRIHSLIQVGDVIEVNRRHD